MTQLGRNPPVSISTIVLDGYLLDGCAYRSFFGARLLSSKPSIKPSPADLRQPTHPFHAQFALQ
jgi:hypothetical protein